MPPGPVGCERLLRYRRRRRCGGPRPVVALAAVIRRHAFIAVVCRCALATVVPGRRIVAFGGSGKPRVQQQRPENQRPQSLPASSSPRPCQHGVGTMVPRSPLEPAAEGQLAGGPQGGVQDLQDVRVGGAQHQAGPDFRQAQGEGRWPCPGRRRRGAAPAPATPPACRRRPSWPCDSPGWRMGTAGRGAVGGRRAVGETQVPQAQVHVGVHPAVGPRPAVPDSRR